MERLQHLFELSEKSSLQIFGYGHILVEIYMHSGCGLSTPVEKVGVQLVITISHYYHWSHAARLRAIYFNQFRFQFYLLSYSRTQLLKYDLGYHFKVRHVCSLLRS